MSDIGRRDDETGEPDAHDEQDVAEALDEDQTGSNEVPVGAPDDPSIDFPTDRPRGVTEVGTTDREQETGETLRERRGQEQPDVDRPDYVAEDEQPTLLMAAEEPDADGELLGEVGDDFGPPPAEESAVHITENP